MPRIGVSWTFALLLAVVTGRAVAQSRTCATLAGAMSEAEDRRTTVVPDTILTDPRGGPDEWRRPGCVLSVVDTTSRDGAPTDLIEELFRMNGWEYRTEYGADGPDGTMFAFQSTGELCVVRGSWDGGDDSDPTVVPAPGFTVVVECVAAAPRGRGG